MKITVAFDTIYSDASGAPALVTVDGVRFAVDWLGEIRMNGTGTGRKPNKRQAAIAERAYRAALIARVDASWIEENRRMYAE
jgi:hypothetical protein